MLREALHFTQAKLRPRATHTQATLCGGFLHSAAMPHSTALESHMYGDPMEVYAAKQAREKRKAENPAPKRPILTLKSRKSDGEWSEARKAAEALFDFPAAASR